MKNNLRSIFIRYLILVLAALPGLGIFYFIFSPLTVYPVFWLLSLFFEPSFCTSCGAINTILIDNFRIEIIGSCIAGSAYYFLLILNLATPNIKIKPRLKMLLGGFLVFLVMNILRIFFMSLMYMDSSALFDFAHKFIWYIGTTIFILGIWFVQVKMFKIKDIPFYSDVKLLYKGTKRK
jgi:exosortase/archaeosortase family protein